MSDWSGLTQHLLGFIFDRLPLPDLIRSRAVCKSWLLAASDETSPNRPRSPLLMLAGDASDENSEFRTILSLSDNRIYRMHLPQIRGRRCLGTAESWLVTADDVAELHLFNPFTRTEYDLPSIITLSVIKGVQRDEESIIIGYMYQARPTHDVVFHDLKFMLMYFHCRAIIFTSDDPTSITVFIIYNGAFQYLAFARLGDERWTELNNCCHYQFFTDVLLHKGEYYGVVKGAGCCIGFDISSSPPRMTFVGPFNHGDTTRRFYLVESLNGDLLQIWRHESWVTPDEDYNGEMWHSSWIRPGEDYNGELSSSGKVFETRNFTVFKLEREEMKMVRVERLEEGTALFIGDNLSMLLKTRDLPELKDNCIYFTDGDTEQYIDLRHMRRDVGVFNMKDGSVQPLYPRESPIDRLTWPPPVWLTPLLP